MAMDGKIKRLLKDLHNSDDDLRALSAMTLMKLEFADGETRSEVVTNLVKATQDVNVSVRFFARKALDKISKTEKMMVSSIEGSSVPVEERLVSTNFRTRLSAVMDIKNKAQKGDESVSEYKSKLVEMLQTEDHPFVVAGLISCLKYFLAKEEASILSKFLTDVDNRVRSNTIEAIEYLKAEEAIPSLFSALSDHDNRIRAVAAKALQSFGEEKVFTELKKMLDAPEDWMKFSAIYALSHIQDGNAINLLMETAKNSTNVEVKSKAIMALGNYYDSAVYSFLKGVGLNGDEAIKDAVAKAFKLIEEKNGTDIPTTTVLTATLTSSENNGSTKNNEEVKNEDFATTVTNFFKKSKEEAIGFSNRAAIDLALSDLKKELDEHTRDVGRTVFDIYQGGELDAPELLTIGHEILRMNYFIQKYSDQSSGKKSSKSEGNGFFAQLKSFFSPKTQEEKNSASQVEKFTKRRDDLMFKLGQIALKKYDDKEDEFKPKVLEGQYLAYNKLAKRLETEQKRLEENQL